MATVSILLFLLTLDVIHCQSFGDLPATVTQIADTVTEIESQMLEVVNSTAETTALLGDFNQQLTTISKKQADTEQILAVMAALLEKQDEKLNNQNQILTTQSNMLQEQNRILDSVVTLLQRHDEQLRNITEQQSDQNQIMTKQNNLIQEQNRILEHNNENQMTMQTSLIREQNRILEDAVALLQKHEQQLENITDKQLSQNQILTSQTNLTEKQEQILENAVGLLQHQDQQLAVIIAQEGNTSQILASQTALLEYQTQQKAITNQIEINNTKVLEQQLQDQIGSRQILNKLADHLQQLDSNLYSITSQILPSNSEDHQAWMLQIIADSLHNISDSIQEFSKGTVSVPMIAQSCQDIMNQGHTDSNAIYTIQIQSSTCPRKNLQVMCDLETACGGWIVIQRRFNGSENFYRSWEDYKHGFGDLNGEFWLGLEKMHDITGTGLWQLRVELEDFSGATAYTEYEQFSIGDETSNYALLVSDFSGTAGDSLTPHCGIGFSTYDRDNDHANTYSCAVFFHGAWWFDDCGYASLNGVYETSSKSGGDDSSNGMWWWEWKSDDEPLRRTEMKIRPI